MGLYDSGRFLVGLYTGVGLHMGGGLIYGGQKL